MTTSRGRVRAFTHAAAARASGRSRASHGVIGRTSPVGAVSAPTVWMASRPSGSRRTEARTEAPSRGPHAPRPIVAPQRSNAMATDRSRMMPRPQPARPSNGRAARKYGSTGRMTKAGRASRAKRRTTVARPPLSGVAKMPMKAAGHHQEAWRRCPMFVTMRMPVSVALATTDPAPPSRVMSWSRAAPRAGSVVAFRRVKICSHSVAVLSGSARKRPATTMKVGSDAAITTRTACPHDPVPRRTSKATNTISANPDWSESHPSEARITASRMRDGFPDRRHESVACRQRAARRPVRAYV